MEPQLPRRLLSRRPWSRVRCGDQAVAGPTPDTVDLDLQREAEEDSDHDDDAEDRDAFERRVDDDRPDDVSDDQYFQSQQDAAAQVAAQTGIGAVKGLGAPGAHGESDECAQPAEDHDPRADCLDDLDDVFDRLFVGQETMADSSLMLTTVPPSRAD